MDGILSSLNEVHHKDSISGILWYSDWLHNTISPNSIFVTNHNTTFFCINHNTTSCREKVLCNLSDYGRI